MRTSSAFVHLLVAAASAPAVLAAPIPPELVAEWESRLAVIAGRAPGRMHDLSAVAVAALADESDQPAIAIDNRHYTPSDAISPSAVLAKHRPIVTTYLMGLGGAKVRLPVATGTATGGSAAVETAVPIRVKNVHDEVEIVLVDEGVEALVEAAKASTTKAQTQHANAGADTKKGATPSDSDVPESLKMEARPRITVHPSELPCYYAQLRRDYNDMMVISLVAVFLLVIVAVELWDGCTEQYV